MCTDNFSRDKGQLLFEVLVVISIAAIILTLSSQLVYVSLQSNRAASEKNTALGLMQEALDAVRSATFEKWHNLYNLTKATAQYYPQRSSGKWILVAGTEDVIIDSITYTRFFRVRNVCRDASTKDITGISDNDGAATTCTVSGGTFDPSAQQVTVHVSWPNADPIFLSEYVARWHNAVCVQTAWNSTSSGVKTCPDSTYESQANIDFSTPGSIKISQ